MLNKSWITNIEVHSEEWYEGRLARFTASEFYRFMGEKPFTIGAISYIYDKVGEEATGMPQRDDIKSEATNWGLENENANLQRFMQERGVKFLVTQKLIAEPKSRFGCTPDALITVRESTDKTAYEVETVEAKCNITYNKFIKLALCETPADVKKAEPIYYHQVLFQMDMCGALKGYLSLFHPLFRFGGFKVIEFKKVELYEDFKLLTQRKKMAEEKYIEVREKLIALK